jgi:hypothetical protein
MSKVAMLIKVLTGQSSPGPQPPVVKAEPNTVDTKLEQLKNASPEIARRLQGVTIKYPDNDPDMKTGAYYDPGSREIRVKIGETDTDENVIDNILYESCNAENTKKFAEIDKKFSGNKFNRLGDYGTEFATQEFESTFTYLKLLLSMDEGERERSPRAAKSLAWARKLAPGFDADPEGKKAALLQAFLDAPHSEEAGPTSFASLSTPAMYMCQKAQDLSGTQVNGLLTRLSGRPPVTLDPRHKTEYEGLKLFKELRVLKYQEMLDSAKEKVQLEADPTKKDALLAALSDHAMPPGGLEVARKYIRSPAFWAKVTETFNHLRATMERNYPDEETPEPPDFGEDPATLVSQIGERAQQMLARFPAMLYSIVDERNKKGVPVTTICSVCSDPDCPTGPMEKYEASF